MNQRRVKLTFLFVSAAELANKLIPIFMIRLGQAKLSLETLGYAQFGLTIVESFLPFMIWGFELYGPISLRDVPKGSDEWKKRIGQILGARLVLGALVTLALVASLFFYPKFVPYRGVTIILAGLMFLSSLGTTFVHTADQSLTVLARITIVAKFASLALALLLVHNDSDGITYAVLNYGVNVAISLGSLGYVLKTYGVTWPRYDGLRQTVMLSLPFALTYIAAMLVEKIEMYYAERWGGMEATGALSGPLKLYQGLLFLIIALSAVLYSEGLAYQEKVGRFLRLTVWILASFILPLMVGVYFVGEAILVTVQGPAFAGQGRNLAFLCTGMLGHSLLLVAGVQALNALGKTRWTNYAYLGAFVLGVAGSELLVRLPDPNYTLLAPAIAKTIAGLVLLKLAMNQTEGFKTVVLPYKGIAAGLIVMSLFLWFTPEVFWVARLAGAVLVYAIGYAPFSYPVLRRLFRKEGFQ